MKAVTLYDHGRVMRLRRLAEQVHELGPPAMLHALREVADGADLEPVLKRFAKLDAAFVRHLGGDRFATPILHSITGSAA